MKYRSGTLFLSQFLVFGFWLGSVTPRVATGQVSGSDAVADSPSTPVSRMDEPAWKGRFERKQETLKKVGKIDLLFLGDSITNNYEREDPSRVLNYRPVWNYYYGDRNALNLGFSGDTTGNLLWRIDHDEIAHLQPRLVVLLIGTNNTSSKHRNWTADQDTAAIEHIIAEVRALMPAAHVLLVGMLPSNQGPWKKEMTNQINSQLASRFDQGGVPWVFYIDISSVFLKNGHTDDALFVEPTKRPPQGAVHPTARGQALMAAALEPSIAHLLGDAAKRPMQIP
jgi:lysophospholipase L1-like esterase